MTSKAKPPGAGGSDRAAADLDKAASRPNTATKGRMQAEREAARNARTPTAPRLPSQLIGIAAEFGHDFAADALFLAALLRHRPERATLGGLDLSVRAFPYRSVLADLIEGPAP
jgi:hypothetical protein